MLDRQKDLIPEEEISDEERLEIHKIREETKRGEKFRLDDVLTDICRIEEISIED